MQCSAVKWSEVKCRDIGFGFTFSHSLPRYSRRRKRKKRAIPDDRDTYTVTFTTLSHHTWSLFFPHHTSLLTRLSPFLSFLVFVHSFSQIHMPLPTPTATATAICNLNVSPPPPPLFLSFFLNLSIKSNLLSPHHWNYYVHLCLI